MEQMWRHAEKANHVDAPIGFPNFDVVHDLETPSDLSDIFRA
jgi:hypothetical protein